MTRSALRVPLIAGVLLLAVSLIGLQCPIVVCSGCAGADVIVKQVGVLTLAAACAAVTSTPGYEDTWAAMQPSSIAVVASASSAFMCTRLII
ncbi:MAG: hypothetical protein VB139_05820 [Coriobacteriia bacterium]|nr:hypothetical protein [Coriobacteriia bacterium]